MKVAIVGTGIAGLTAGWMLNRAGYDVVLLERMPRLGLDAHSVDLGRQLTGVANDSEFVNGIRADVPPRMFNASLWPSLDRLYKLIGVAVDPVDASKMFGELGRPPKLRLAESFVSKISLRDLLRPAAWRIRQDILRMKSDVTERLTTSALDKLDFETYLRQRDFSNDFVDYFLLPSLSSTLCTCSYASLKRYPAKIVLHSMLELVSSEALFRVRSGSSDVAARLSRDITDIRFETVIESIFADDEQVQARLVSGEVIVCDHLVLATQANTANGLLARPSAKEQAMLESFSYESVDVLLHRDQQLMPRRRRDWSNFNVLTNQQRSAAMCTVWMNRFCRDWDLETDVFQTISPFVEPNEDKIICRRRLQRPVVNWQSLAGLQLLNDLHQEPTRRIWFCGSYASTGVPLLESGVASSVRVVELIRNRNKEVAARL